MSTKTSIFIIFAICLLVNQCFGFKCPTALPAVCKKLNDCQNDCVKLCECIGHVIYIKIIKCVLKIPNLFVVVTGFVSILRVK